MIQASKLFKDRPMNPIDTGIFWIEFVLRNDGSAGLMKPLSYSLSWWQRHLLDVYIVLFFIAIAMAIISLVLMRKLVVLLTSKSKQTERRVSPEIIAKKKKKRN